MVDTGSTDDTAAVVRGLATERRWIELVDGHDPHATGRGAPIVRGFERGVGALDGTPDRDREGRRRHLLRTRPLRAPARRVQGRPERSASRAATPPSSRTACGSLATTPAQASGVRPAPTARRACRRSCRSSAAWAGTASTSSRHTCAAGAPAPWWTSRSATTAGRASATVAAGARGPRAAEPLITWAIDPGSWPCDRCTTHAANPLPWAWSGATAAALLGRRSVCQDAAVRAELRRTQSLRTLADRRRRAVGVTAE